MLFYLCLFYIIDTNNMPSLKAYFTNMSAPMPLYRKLFLVLKNSAIRIFKRQNCCGHPGEPGC